MLDTHLPIVKNTSSYPFILDNQILDGRFDNMQIRYSINDFILHETWITMPISLSAQSQNCWTAGLIQSSVVDCCLITNSWAHSI
jgi:hypothetical protein